jgi:hypothetical protein
MGRNIAGFAQPRYILKLHGRSSHPYYQEAESREVMSEKCVIIGEDVAIDRAERSTIHTKLAMASTSSTGNWLSMFHYVAARGCLRCESIILKVLLIGQNRICPATTFVTFWDSHP